MAAIERINWSELSEEELHNIIETAREALEEIKKKRFEEVQEQIRKLASSVGMTPEEVVMQMQRGRRGRASTAGRERNVRYRNPENPDQTWTGWGKRPNWLVEKLEAGAQLSDFKI